MTRSTYLRTAGVILAGMIAVVLLATPSAFSRARRRSAPTPSPTPTATPTPAPTPVTKVWNFDQDKAHQTAAGWKALDGDWQVLPDTNAPSPPNTFGLPPGRLISSLYHMLNYHPMAIISDPAEYSDFTVEADFKPTKGRLDCSGGVVLRYVDPTDYYILTVGCPSDYFRFLRVLKGQVEMLKQQVVPTDTGTWYKLKVRALGDRFTCYDNDKMIFDVNDSKIAKGRLGLWAANDSQARFDNFTITLPLGVEAPGGPEGESAPGAPEAMPPPPPPPPPAP